jgi:hypothetical protein
MTVSTGGQPGSVQASSVTRIVRVSPGGRVAATQPLTRAAALASASVRGPSPGSARSITGN